MIVEAKRPPVRRAYASERNPDFGGDTGCWILDAGYWILDAGCGFGT